MRSESNFSDIYNYNYNYNYRDPDYQVVVPPVAVCATLLVIPIDLNSSFLIYLR